MKLVDEPNLYGLRRHRPVSEHCSFGMSSRAARVHLVQILVFGDNPLRRSGLVVHYPLLVMVPSCRTSAPDSDEACDGLQLRADCVHGAKESLFGDDHLRARVIDDVAPL